MDHPSTKNVQPLISNGTERFTTGDLVVFTGGTTLRVIFDEFLKNGESSIRKPDGTIIFDSKLQTYLKTDTLTVEFPALVTIFENYYPWKIVGRKALAPGNEIITIEIEFNGLKIIGKIRGDLIKKKKR